MYQRTEREHAGRRAEQASGEIAAEVWSRTAVSTSLFTSGIRKRVWDLKPGEEWRAIPDQESQADFVIKPGQRIAFPEQISRATRKDGSVIRVKNGVVVNEESEPLILTILGVRLEVDRKPDAESMPEPVDIDNW